MLRKILLTSASVVAFGGVAFAADLPTTKGPAMYTPPPPVFTWTGLYIGGQVGYEWGRTYTTAFAGPAVLGGVAYTNTGVVGGGHIGYNYQFNQFVIGVEGSLDGSSYRGSSGTPVGAIVGSKQPLDGSVRLRFGYAWDRALIYGTGGVAFGDFNDFDNVGDSIWNTRVGWTAGGGLEYAVDNNWSVRAEYRYTQFGRYYETPAALPFPGLTSVSIRQIDNRVQAGFSYKFDMMGAPVVSKY